MEICENVQFLCKKKGLPISHLEKELILANGSIRRWNESSPSVDKIQKVADYFGVTADFIIHGFDKEIIETIKALAKTDNKHLYFPSDVLDILNVELEPLKKEYWDVPLDLTPTEIIGLLTEFPVTTDFKKDLLDLLNRVKQRIDNLNSLPELVQMGPENLSMVQVPVLGTIKAGYDLLAEQQVIGHEWVPKDYVRDGEYFFLKVTGDSMIDEGIREGYRVLVKRQNFVDEGKIGVVLINGDEATLKRIFYRDNTLILQASNRNVPPRVVPIDEARIQGQVIKVEWDV